MNNLLRFNKDQLYMIFDTETCHTNLALENYPWQCGFVITDSERILEKHNYYIYWDNILEKISEGAKKATNFNYEVYKKNARPQTEILDIFESYLYDDKYIKIGHNIYNFDIFVHNQWRKLYNGRKTDYSYLSKTLDTDALARAWKLGIKEIKREEWVPSMFKYGSYIEKGLKTNLTALGKEFGIKVDYTALHDALNDVSLNFLVWNQLKYRIDI